MNATRCLWSPVANALGRRALRSVTGLGVKYRAPAGPGRSGVLVGGAGTPSPPALPVTVSARGLPVCSVATNLDAVPNDFIGGLSKVIAETLGKPEKLISASISTKVQMLRNGNADPTVVVEIWSIGVFDAERNKKYTKDIFKYITTKLKNIQEDRVVLLFHPLQSQDAGHLIYQSLK